MKYLDEEFIYEVENDDFIVNGVVPYTLMLTDGNSGNVIGMYKGNVWCEDTLKRSFDFTELVRQFVADYIHKNNEFPMSTVLSLDTATGYNELFSDVLFPAYRYPHKGVVRELVEMFDGSLLRQDGGVAGAAATLLPSQIPASFLPSFKIWQGARDGVNRLVDDHEHEVVAARSNYFEFLTAKAGFEGSLYVASGMPTEWGDLSKVAPTDVVKNGQFTWYLSMGTITILSPDPIANFSCGTGAINIALGSVNQYTEGFVYDAAGFEINGEEGGGVTFTLPQLKVGNTYRFNYTYYLDRSGEYILSLNMVQCLTYSTDSKTLVGDVVTDCGLFLAWYDRLGSMQVQPFNNIPTFSESITASELTAYNGRRSTYKVEVQPKFRVNSGWIADKLYPYYESILVSPSLTLYDATNGVAYDVIIASRDYTEKTFENQSRQLFCMTLDLEVTNKQTIIQR